MNEKPINEYEISEEYKETGLEGADNIENECQVIEKLIESNIVFSEKEKILLIYMKYFLDISNRTIRFSRFGKY